MKKLLWLALTAAAALTACGPTRVPVNILDGASTCRLTTTERLPADLLADCELSLGQADRLLYLGGSAPLEVELPEAEAYQLVVRRAVLLTVVTPDGTRTLSTSALSVGQALAEAGYELYAADRFDPAVETALDGDLTVSYTPSRLLVVERDGTQTRVRTSADTIGHALAEGGLPLVGLDTSQPASDDTLPADGTLHLTRVVEAVLLTQKSLPYQTRTELSADLEIDQQVLLQGGEPGLAVARTRVVQADGLEVASQAEGESIVHPPEDRILGIGTKIVIRSTVVDGVAIEYWRALTVFSTYYWRDTDRTASGKINTGKVVAMVLPWFRLFRDQPVYVPGYGYAVVDDTNGASTSERWGTYWIDVSFRTTNTRPWSNHYLTIYFLTPVPANVADTYLLP